MGTKLFLCLFIALSIYIVGLLAFFSYPQLKNKDMARPYQVVSAELPPATVLSSQTQNMPPASHSIVVVPRRQVFNLSCEFAVAASIVYHYTGNPLFSKNNAKDAEKILMHIVGVSQNPNVGIRMGETVPVSSDELYANLNKRFGGSDYYGVHAPPFIDAFAKYGLTAKPIFLDDHTIYSLQKALYDGHLVMAWLKIGYGRPVDVSFSYGSVPVIKGEHSVVITGYDSKGVVIMDPGNGGFSHITYENLLAATSYFAMPFLAISGNNPSASLEETLMLEKIIGLPRENVSIIIQNTTKEAGKATQMAEILQEFGYKVVEVTSSRKEEYSDVSIILKESHKDYGYLLKKDLSVAQYLVASVSANLEDHDSDVLIILGN